MESGFFPLIYFSHTHSLFKHTQLGGMLFWVLQNTHATMQWPTKTLHTRERQRDYRINRRLPFSPLHSTQTLRDPNDSPPYFCLLLPLQPATAFKLSRFPTAHLLSYSSSSYTLNHIRLGLYGCSLRHYKQLRCFPCFQLCDAGMRKYCAFCLYCVPSRFARG